MPDEANKTTAPDKVAAKTEKSAEAANNADVPVLEPSLAEDYLRLEQINLLRAVIVRMQGGCHPDKLIEALLRRRMNLAHDEFQGPYAIRLVCTLMMIFVFSVSAWAVIWAIGSALELNYFLRLVSTGLATLFAAVAGVAVFHPSSIPEEKTLVEAIEVRMVELRKELIAEADQQQASVSENVDNDSVVGNVQADKQAAQPVAEQTLKTGQVAASVETAAADLQKSPVAETPAPDVGKKTEETSPESSAG